MSDPLARLKAAVSPDDQRFVMFQAIRSGTGELIWVENWFEELREKAGNE